MYDTFKFKNNFKVTLRLTANLLNEPKTSSMLLRQDINKTQ